MHVKFEPMARLSNVAHTEESTPPLRPSITRSLPSLFFQFLDGSLDKRGCAPLLLTAADVNNEILQELLALLRMEHFGVELHGPERLLRAGVSGKLHVGRRRYGVAVGRYRRDGVAVAHPHLRVFLEALEQRILSIERSKMGTAVLTGISLFHLSTVLGCYELRSVAYSKDGKLAYKLAQVCLESLGVVD